MLNAKHLQINTKCLIRLTCSCHIHVCTQQLLQWDECVEQHSKKSNHDNKCLEPSSRHWLISSMYSTSFPISPHPPFFPRCTFPLPSTAPPSWSHLEPEQVLRRDRGSWREASPPGLMTPAPFSAHDAETFFSAAARLKPDENRKHRSSRVRLKMVSYRWGRDCFECMNTCYSKTVLVPSSNYLCLQTYQSCWPSLRFCYKNLKYITSCYTVCYF